VSSANPSADGAFVWDPVRGFTTLPDLLPRPVPGEGQAATVVGLSARGIITGNAPAADGTSHAVAWWPWRVTG
jgi:hypothetical protein